MATNVSQGEILDAIRTQLVAKMMPATGGAVTTDKPIRSVERFSGAEFTTAEGFKRGIAGRCPAIRVRYVRSRTLKTHVGRRVDRFESTYSVIVCTDDERGKDSRKSLLPLVDSVGKLVGSRRFLKAINPMRWQSTDVLRDDEQLLAYALTFTTKHRVDYTIDAGTDVMESASGDINNPEDLGGATKLQVDVALEETA